MTTEQNKALKKFCEDNHVYGIEADLLKRRLEMLLEQAKRASIDATAVVRRLGLDDYQDRYTVRSALEGKVMSELGLSVALKQVKKQLLDMTLALETIFVRPGSNAPRPKEFVLQEEPHVPGF